MILTVIIGALMGLLNHTKRNNNIKKPRNLKTAFDPGFQPDCLYGVVGAVITVLMGEPTEIGRVIILAIIGGQAGETAVLTADANNKKKNEEALKKVNDQINEKLPSPSKKKSTKQEDAKQQPSQSVEDVNQDDKKEQE
jgi:hypothetical protein